MKTTERIIIGVWLATFYYMLDATIDFLIRKDFSLGEIAFTNIPPGELFNRIFGVLLVLAALFYYFWNRAKKDQLEPEKESEDPDVFIHEQLLGGGDDCRAIKN